MSYPIRPLGTIAAWIALCGAAIYWGTAEPPPESGPAAIVPEFYDLAERDYPASFTRHFGEPGWDSYLDAIEIGGRVYREEGCYHCHTQYVREGTRDVDRWGSAHDPSEYDAPWHAVPMLGARRVGPDLGRESNRRSNDWHAAHLYAPPIVSPGSVMPAFPWLFEEVSGRVLPTRDGLALIVYLQSLGSSADEDHR